MNTRLDAPSLRAKRARTSMAVALCVVAAAALALLCSCAAPAKSTVSVTLASHGATGYTWNYVASPDDVLKETSHDTKADTSLAGGDVADTFTFAAQKSGEVTLAFSLTRSWENAEGNENPDTATYVFKVDDAKNVTLVSSEGTAESIPEPVIS